MTIHNKGIDAGTRGLAKNLEFKRNTNEHKLPKQQFNHINQITKSTISPNQKCILPIIIILLFLYDGQNWSLVNSDQNFLTGDFLWLNDTDYNKR